MVKSLSSEVLLKINEIVNYIEESDIYKRYKDIENKMEKDLEIMTKVNQIKTLQKQIVKKEVKEKDISTLEKEIEGILDELNNYPIYQEYSYLQEDLNNTFQSIKSIIENYINSKLN